MNKTLVGLVLVALLTGLIGGYGLGYLIYQPQVQAIQKDLGDLDDRFDTFNSTLRDTKTSVASLNSTVQEIESMTWHEASSLEGSASAIGSTFQIKGKWMRIRWIMEGVLSSAWIHIYINFPNGTLFAERGSSGVYGSYACDIAETNLPNEYYIEVIAYSVSSYLVVVWDYY